MAYGGMKPRTDALPRRLMAFFAANPNEELTPEQVALKFDVRPNTVTLALGELSLCGALEVVRIVRLPSKGRASST